MVICKVVCKARSKLCRLPSSLMKMNIHFTFNHQPLISWHFCCLSPLSISERHGRVFETLDSMFFVTLQPHKPPPFASVDSERQHRDRSSLHPRQTPSKAILRPCGFLSHTSLSSTQMSIFISLSRPSLRTPQIPWLRYAPSPR